MDIKILALFLLLAAATHVTAVAGPPMSSEIAPFLAIKGELDPSGVVLGSWVAQHSCATWLGLTCDSAGYVTSINFGLTRTFTGGLSPALGQLLRLETLVVRTDGFPLSTSIPAALGELINLRKLVLTGATRSSAPRLVPGWFPTDNLGNGLSGALPPAIAKLPKLQYLDLSQNGLSGKLPSFAASIALQYLDVSGNLYQSGYFNSTGLQGALPTFGIGASLAYLNVAQNAFNSYGDLAALSKLKYLNLGNNSFTSLHGFNITSPLLTYLNLSVNHFAGPLPDLAAIKSLRVLDLAGNPGFSGRLPASYSNLTNLRVLNLNLTSIYGLTATTGAVPAAYGNLTNLVVLAISCPQFTGSVDAAFPPSLANLQQLKSLTIDSLGLHPRAGLPSFIGEVRGLKHLSAYEFVGSEKTGAFPANLASLTNLTSLVLGDKLSFDKKLSGSLPQFVLKLKALQYLDLANNGFIGPLWGNLSIIKGLTYIDLSSNYLTGTIADVINANSGWQTIALSSSGLAGPVPASIGRLKHLRSLSLKFPVVPDNTPPAYGHSTAGSLPSTMSNLTSLQYLSIINSYFTGVLPNFSATKLTDLLAADNLFVGAVRSCHLASASLGAVARPPR